MGIHDRDYYRGATRGSLNLTGASPMCMQLIIANVIVFVLQILITHPAQFDPRDFPGVPPEHFEQLQEQLEQDGRFASRVSVVEEWCELDPAKAVKGGQIWRFITYAFCHDRGGPGGPGIYHILFNMLGLWFFGPALEALYGSREFLKFYLTGAGVAGLLHVAFAFAINSRAPAIGASGAVMAVLMLYALYYPRHTLMIMFVLPIEARWLVALYVVWDLLPVLSALGGSGSHDNVAHAAHLGGLAYGFLYKKYDLRYGNWGEFNLGRRWRDLFRRRSLRVHRPPEISNLEKQVDDILAKISREGEASLTDGEREVLKEASRRARKR